jgi:hypothetical protein
MSRWVFCHIYPEFNQRIALDEAARALAQLVGEANVLQAFETMSSQQITKTPIPIYAFEITPEGHYILAHGFLGRGPFGDWVGPIPVEEAFVRSTPTSIEDLVGWEIRRIPHDSPIKDRRERRVTFIVDENNVIQSYSFG